MGIEPYVRLMADLLGLKDWEFIVNEDANTGAYGATCAVVVGQKRAVLSFASGFCVLPPSQQRQTIIHEALHCHVDRWKIVVNRLTDVVSPRELHLLELALRDVIEEGIDGIATAIAATMPLPEEIACAPNDLRRPPGEGGPNAERCLVSPDDR